MSKILASLIAFLSLLTISCKESIESKVNRISELNKKYKNSKISSLSEIEASKNKIYRYVNYLHTLYGKNMIPNIDRTTDSLFNELLIQNNIDLNQFKLDTATANRIIPAYFPDNSNIYYNDEKVGVDIAVAFTNDPNRSYKDLFHYIENGYFINGENKNRKNQPTLISKEEVEKWMSGWDGSIKDFVEQIKSKLDDPDSFEHVETKYSIKSNPVKVRMKFRNKNKYNAIVTNEVEGLLDIKNGEISSVILLD